MNVARGQAAGISGQGADENAKGIDAVKRVFGFVEREGIDGVGFRGGVPLRRASPQQIQERAENHNGYISSEGERVA